MISPLMNEVSFAMCNKWRASHFNIFLVHVHKSKKIYVQNLAEQVYKRSSISNLAHFVVQL